MNRWWPVAGLGVLAGLLFLVWGATGQQRHPVVAAAVPAVSADPQNPPATEQAGDAADSLAQATAAAEARLQASLERLAREDRERAEAHARERADAERRQKEAEQARRRDAAAAVARADPVTVPQAARPVPAAPSPAERALPENRTVAVTALVPATVPSVEQRCADSGNFFSRSVCQSQACAEPALAQDPACRRLRELEQLSRPDPTLLN